MILKGFIGTVYVRIDKNSRIDLWRTDVFMKQEDVVNEMLENKAAEPGFWDDMESAKKVLRS